MYQILSLMPKFCTTCGKPLQFENAEICPNCGVRFQGQNAQVTAEKSPGIAAITDKEKNKHYQMDLLAIGLGLAIFAASIIFNFDPGFLSLIAIVLIIVGIFSLVRRQIFNR
jgi:uncharacterized membrane protein YvbJ